jgi:SAM-dependent methyltransferase
MSPPETAGQELTTCAPRGAKLINRYKRNYAIPNEALVTEEMILGHWDMERRLTQELLASRPEQRWEVFERCYSELYGSLDWLNRLTQTDDAAQSAWRNNVWEQLIGPAPQRIYEIGSGKARLITWLAEQGYVCRATEVTRERGRIHSQEIPNLSWGLSDGIHLDRFESAGSYDTVISDNVLEHLHPDDISDHLKSVCKLLVPGGRYIFCTPHKCAGPNDISGVFGRPRPEGMHLREYTWSELRRLSLQAGFDRCHAALVLPERWAQRLDWILKPGVHTAYLTYLRTWERLLLMLPESALRRKTTRLLKLALFPSAIFMVACKN